MQRSTVYLPEPLGPMITSTLPCATDRLTLSTARSRPNCLTRFLMTIISCGRVSIASSLIAGAAALYDQAGYWSTIQRIAYRVGYTNTRLRRVQCSRHTNCTKNALSNFTFVIFVPFVYKFLGNLGC